MDLLLSPKIVSNYIMNSSKIGKSEEELIVNLLFENQNNNFIINKSILNLYEAEFPEESIERNIYQTQLTILINERSINKSSNNSTLVEILQETNDKYLNEKNNNETYLNLSDNEQNSINNNFTGLLSNFSNISSKDYLYFNLAAKNPNCLTYRYYNFNNNSEIVNLLNYLYDLRTVKFVDIFDRNINLTHNFYNKLLNSGLRFIYFTIRKHNIVEKRNDFYELRSFFKKVMVYRSIPNNIHERRIMFNNIIIECDDDFANVQIERNTWKIDIYVCNNSKQQIDIKKEHFVRDNFN